MSVFVGYLPDYSGARRGGAEGRFLGNCVGRAVKELVAKVTQRGDSAPAGRCARSSGDWMAATAMMSSFMRCLSSTRARFDTGDLSNGTVWSITISRPDRSAIPI